MKRGYLVVLTGIDGSGKTTQANLLVNDLKKSGIEVSYVWSRWEPLLLRPLINRWKRRSAEKRGKSNQEYDDIKERKKILLNNRFLRWLWLLCFFIDYGLQILVKVRLRLLAKKLIVSDRIFYDSMIDQAINLGERGDWLLGSLDSYWMKSIFPKPDTVVYIDCPPDIALSRKEDAPNVDYLAERRALYLQLAKKYEWFIVDGTLQKDKIAICIRNRVCGELKQESIID